MLKAQVQIGETYQMRHSSGLIKVRILRVKPYHTLGFWNSASRPKVLTHWEALNLKTGRTITIKSAAKLKPAS